MKGVFNDIWCLGVILSRDYTDYSLRVILGNGKQ